MSVRDYIEQLRAKPEAVRRRIVLGTSAAVSLVVAVGWFGALAASGELAFDNGQPNQATADLMKATEKGSAGFSDLLGAVGSAQQQLENGAPIQVVETRASSTLETSAAPEATVIPF